MSSWIATMRSTSGTGSAGKDRWARAVADVEEGLGRWQLWWLLGLNDIRQRYRRSSLGQFWITLSMAAFICAIGIVYSFLFNMTIREYLPYLAVNMIVWTLMASVLNEGCMVFTQSESYIRQERLPKTIFLMRLLVRNSLIFGHNALIIPVVFLIFGVSVSWTALLAIPGLLILAVNGFLAALFLGIICTRFRDLPQIVANVVQIAFFVTPVMWQKQQISGRHAYVLEFNPFASHLSVVADPLLGKVPSLSDYGMCLLMTVFSLAVVLPFFARFRERIVYWL
jgi:ABC-type polysaccharide/polyol phosphate export permease